MTLVELLIVITVMVILLGAALPVMKVAMEGGKAREASRQLNTSFALAKARAIETGRLAGLWIEPETFSGSGAPYATRVFIAETPLPYSGDIVGARLKITKEADGDYRATEDAAGSSDLLRTIAKVNDYITFDYKGPLYRITEVGSNSDYVEFEKRDSLDPDPLFDKKLPYQVFRQPRKSATRPMELPGGTVIDLQNSGLGLTGIDNTFNTTAPIVIVFEPSGQVGRILDMSDTPTETVPTDTIHFLIGRIDQVGIDGEDFSSPTYGKNLEDANSIWVSIGHLTGQITTAENAWSKEGSFDESIKKAREFAHAAESIGGR